jgi:hypothetical protein
MAAVDYSRRPVPQSVRVSRGDGSVLIGISIGIAAWCVIALVSGPLVVRPLVNAWLDR